MQRRDFLRVAPAIVPGTCLAQPPALARRIPQLPEPVPAVGMGTWLTFDIGDVPGGVAQRREVLRRFFAAGGALLDSSPMYGRAERLLGELLPGLAGAGRLVSETKVWTPFERLGDSQLDLSRRLWRVSRFDVLLVHNLLNWRGHLKTLRRWKDDGRVRAIGVSTSHGSRHDDAERAIRTEPLDVLQITYNLADTRAERLMGLAAERGMAVVINRPFDGGALFDRVGSRPLPDWAGDIDAVHWSQVFLKWVLGHPAVTCAIPATRQPAHMDENMAALRGRLPDARLRERIAADLRGLVG
jgi:diketogulonate reductase-like aldo/keto reductase